MHERRLPRMNRLFCSLLLILFVTPAIAAEPLIFIVRHAEKSDAAGGDPKNPDLSEAGRTRAEALAHALRDADITAVFATEFKRTQQTAAPVAHAATLETAVVPAKDTADLAQQLRESHGNALVVGHSNTIPELIKALGCDASVTLGEADYDNLFVVITGPEPRLLRLHY